MYQIHLILAGMMVAGMATAAEEAAVDDDVAAGEGRWTRELRIGLFVSSTVADQQEGARDATIAGSNDAFAYQGRLDGGLNYEYLAHLLEQTLVMRYGNQKQEDEPWGETGDRIEYDGTYSYTFEEPHYGFVAWGADSVFTGIEPEEEPLDPFTVKASAGYGQRYESANDDPPRWLVDARIGVRAQKTWGHGLGDEGREIQTGPEGLLRVEWDPRQDLTTFAQYEVFSDFEDLDHTRHLWTAGATVALLSYLQVDLAFRGYYETEPDDAADGAAGYDEFSFVQDALLGLTWEL